MAGGRTRGQGPERRTPTWERVQSSEASCCQNTNTHDASGQAKSRLTGRHHGLQGPMTQAEQLGREKKCCLKQGPVHLWAVLVSLAGLYEQATSAPTMGGPQQPLQGMPPCSYTTQKPMPPASSKPSLCLGAACSVRASTPGCSCLPTSLHASR